MLRSIDVISRNAEQRDKLFIAKVPIQDVIAKLDNYPEIAETVKQNLRAQLEGAAGEIRRTVLADEFKPLHNILMPELFDADEKLAFTLALCDAYAERFPDAGIPARRKRSSVISSVDFDALDGHATP